MSPRIPNDIYFYFRNEEYGWLSNFWYSPQIVDGISYSTNEHYYQSQKTSNPAISKWIADTPKPYLAMIAGRSLRLEDGLRRDWNSIKFDIMLKGLRSKFDNPDLRAKLLSTGNVGLHEDSPSDLVWGVKGADMLGKLLMQVRDEFRTSSSQ